MHYLSICILLITILVVINARSPFSSKSLADDDCSCPEKRGTLRRRNDEASSESDDSDDDESRENVCEQAMDIIVQHRNIVKLNPSILLTYCPHYNERLALVRENNNNNTLFENKKQEFNIKQQQQLKKKRDDDFSDSNNNNDDDDNKRRALRRRELKKRFALRFLRKRMS